MQKQCHSSSERDESQLGGDGGAMLTEAKGASREREGPKPCSYPAYQLKKGRMHRSIIARPEVSSRLPSLSPKVRFLFLGFPVSEDITKVC